MTISDEVAELHRQGLSDAQIGKRLGKSKDAIRHIRTGTRKNTSEASPVEKLPIDPTHAEIMRLERELDYEKEETRQLSAKLKKSRKAEDLFVEAARVIRDHTRPLPAVAFKANKEKPEGTFDMVLLLSDEHADQVVTAAGTWGMERYDFNVFRCRLERLLKQTINYATKHLPQHDFARLWVLKLGDSVNGDIHGAGARNHFGNTIKAALSVGDCEAQFIQALAPHFSEGVHVVSVAGNHPRRSFKKDYGGPNDNFDYLVTTQIATRLSKEIEAGRVTVHAPDAWTAFVEIRGRVWAMNHGDDVKGFAGIPWYGFERKNNRVQTLVARFDRKVSYFCYGHYHTPINFTSGGAESLHSGAWPMTDPFALNAVTAGNEPRQTLYVVDDPYGVILQVPIYTRNPEREAQCMAGEYEPRLGSRTVVEDLSNTPDVGSFALHRAPEAA